MLLWILICRTCKDIHSSTIYKKYKTNKSYKQWFLNIWFERKINLIIYFP
jgi:hypothetical protein